MCISAGIGAANGATVAPGVGAEVTLAGGGAGLERQPAAGPPAEAWPRAGLASARRFCGQRSGGLFRGDRLSQGVNLGWNRGRQTGDGGFWRWGLGGPGHGRRGCGPPGIHGAVRASREPPGPGSPCRQRPRRPSVSCQSRRASSWRPRRQYRSPRLLRAAPILGITGQGLAKAGLSLLPDGPPGNKRNINYWP